jgi:hypothetical protein
MSRLSLRVFGIEVVSFGSEEPAEGLTEWNGSTHTNGSFERDTEPFSASNEEPYYDGSKIGFLCPPT